MCPGQRESAGKRKSGRTRKGSPALRATLIECAHAAARTKETYLFARYVQVMRRRGKKKAIVAVATTFSRRHGTCCRATSPTAIPDPLWFSSGAPKRSVAGPSASWRGWATK